MCIRDRNSIFIVQSISSPANDNLMELLLCIDALKRSSAKNITAVIPYFGYARQDRKVVPRTSISAKLVSNLITKAGADRVVTVDLHAGQIQGFFDIPVDNLFATPIFARHARKKIKSKKIVCVLGKVEGHISDKPKGKNGFGYDPIFIPLKKRKTFGEMKPSQKYKMDHRYQAFKKIRKFL